jgi:nicotinamide-nucleotide amidase
MRAEILTIGSELTSGATLNTNAAYLARRLAQAGLPCRRQTAVGDERADLARALRDALRRCELLVTTGGLGPTFDDLTMEVIADVVQRPLVLVPAVAARVRRFYVRHRRKLQQAALRQAYLPAGGRALDNPIGTAPGLWLPLAGRLLIALPGVPSEMRAIMDRSIMSRLKRLGRGRIIESRTLRTVGIVELSIQAALKTIRVPPDVEIGLYPSLRMVDVRLTATGSSPQKVRRSLARLERALRRKLGRAVYGSGDETLEEAIGALLVRRRKTLAVAESCTGGLVSNRITDVSGSSRYFRGSVIAYHNDLKRGYLGVPAQTLLRFGAVSAQTARAMAQGIRRMAGADLGLSITGIAGPTGGTKQKPVGLVYLALSNGRTTRVQRCQFFGDRLSIKSQAAQSALDTLRLSLSA